MNNKFIQSTQSLTKEYPIPKGCIHGNDAVRKTILITGASGFLGLHLIQQFSEDKTVEKIICLLRSKEKFNLNKVKFDLNFNTEKIFILEKDLNNLVLDDLYGVTDIIHCAAKIHAIKGFNLLKKDNIEASNQLYQLCAIKKDINLYLISTLSVFVSSNQSGLHQEMDIPINNDYLLYGGYAQTKYIAEYLAPENTTIIRLGLLTASTQTGLFPEHDFFKEFIRYSIRSGIYPEQYKNAWVDISPVDLVSKKIKEIVISNDHQKIIHIANQKSVSLKTIVQDLKLIKTSNQDFVDRLNKESNLIRNLVKNAYFKEDNLTNIDLFQSTNHYWSGDYLLNSSMESIVPYYIKIYKAFENEKIQ